MITDFRYTEQATKQCEGYEVIQYETSVMDTLVDILMTITSTMVSLVLKENICLLIHMKPYVIL